MPKRPANRSPSLIPSEGTGPLVGAGVTGRRRTIGTVRADGRWARKGCTSGSAIRVAQYDPAVRIRPTAPADAEALTDLHLDA